LQCYKARSVSTGPPRFLRSVLSREKNTLCLSVPWGGVGGCPQTNSLGGAQREGSDPTCKGRGVLPRLQLSPLSTGLVPVAWWYKWTVLIPKKTGSLLSESRMNEQASCLGWWENTGLAIQCPSPRKKICKVRIFVSRPTVPPPPHKQSHNSAWGVQKTSKSGLGGGKRN